MRMQEVVGTEEPALDAVVAADAELMALRAEEADIQARLGAVSLEDDPEHPPEASTSAANDADNDRLAAIYDRLAVRDFPFFPPQRLASHRNLSEAI